MGAAWETVAFVTGALGAHNQQSMTLALLHQLFFLLAPLWVNAFAYMTFARAVHFYLPGGRVWRVRGASLAKYFVWADVLAFLVQAGGVLMMSPGASTSTILNGLHVYTAGIGLQEAFVLCFVALMVCFHRKAVALESAGAERGLRERGWRQPLYALYGVLFVISVRHMPPPLAVSGTDLLSTRCASSTASPSTRAAWTRPTHCPCTNITATRSTRCPCCSRSSSSRCSTPAASSSGLTASSPSSRARTSAR
jgi:hypothetical protein